MPGRPPARSSASCGSGTCRCLTRPHSRRRRCTGRCTSRSLAAPFCSGGKFCITRGTQAFGALAVGVLSSMQMGLLGAILTLAERPLFAPHLLTTQAWGFTPLEDQQLGGPSCGCPGSALFLWTSLRSLQQPLGSARKDAACVSTGLGEFPLSYLSAAGTRAERILPLTWYLLWVAIAVCLIIAALLWIAVRRDPSGAASRTDVSAKHPGCALVRGSRPGAVDQPRGGDFRDSPRDCARMDHGHAREHLRASVEPRPRARRDRPPVVVGGALRLGRARAGVSDGERDPHSGG